MHRTVIRDVDLNFETETCIKRRDRDRLHQTFGDSRLENLWMIPKFSKNVCKDVITTSKLKFVRTSSIFLPGLVVSYVFIQQIKNTLNCSGLTKPYRCCIQRLKAIGLWPTPASFRPRQELKPSRLTKMGLETRQSLEKSSLIAMSNRHFFWAKNYVSILA